MFIAGKRIKLEELARLLEAPESEILRAIISLKKKYRGPIVVEFDGNSAVMRVEDKYLTKLWKLGKGELSRGELKTLAVIAYYAPVKQSDVVRIRGNRAYEHIRKLEEYGMIRCEKKGNTKIIYLAQGFYDYFGEEIAERIRGKKMDSGRGAGGSKNREDMEEG